MSTKRNPNKEIEILEAAKEVFHNKGMDGARMQEIADKANINKAMLHYYFRSKQLLFEAVFKHAFSLIAPQLNAILNDATSIEEKIRNFTANYINFIIKHPYLPNFIIQELNRNPNFILQLKGTGNFPNLSQFKKQVDLEISKGLIRPIGAEQLFINILSLNIFPFLGKPLIIGLVDLDEHTFQQLLEDRKTEVSNFIIHAIKPL